MANLVRPPKRLSSDRFVQTKLSFAPTSAPDDTHRSNPHNTTVSTRRTSKSGPLLVLGDDEKTVTQIAQSPTRPAPPPRTSSRKRTSAALDDDAPTPDTRPPTKVVHREPHGELVRITNGVQTLLNIDADDVSSGRSTPAPRPGSAGKLAVPAPAADSKSKDRRSLRSSDGGSRLKSDLAVYFSSYDDIIAGLPKPSEFLDIDTPIYIVDEPTKSKTPAPPSPEPVRKSVSPTRTRKPPRAPTPTHDTSNPPIPSAQSSTTFQVLDYSSIAKHIRNDGEEDPLADSHFFAQHRRAERKEKQLRNIEKERAMHEKQQLERLLDGLQGPDWLRVMGITGVTAGETRDWESKRDYFIKEVEALVDKFRQWKQEEKRIRAEKEAALAARTEDEEEDGEESEASAVIKVSGRTTQPKEQQPKELEPPKIKRPPRPHGFLLPVVPLEPTAPFLSFYAKPHLRAAALGKHRHGRNATAFGQPIPEFEEHEFELPEDYIDPQFLRDNARQRRRRQRERQSGANTQAA